MSIYWEDSWKFTRLWVYQFEDHPLSSANPGDAGSANANPPFFANSTYKKNTHTHPSFFGGLLVPYSKTKNTNTAYECMVTSPSSLQFLEAPDEAGFLQVVNHFAHLRLEYDTSVGTCSVHATRLEHVFGGWIKTRILKGPPHLSFSWAKLSIK